MALVLSGDGRISGANLNIDSDGAATFTGLTVDTNTLHVDETNNRVGIGTTTPGYTLDVTRTGGETDIARLKGNASNAFIRFQDVDNSADYTVGADDLGVSAGAFVIYDRNASQYRLTMNSSGYVTIPYQPYFHATLPSNQTIGSDPELINFSTVVSNVGGHYSSANKRFTCPVAGRYFFSVGIRWNTVNTGPYTRFSLRKNGSGGAATLKIVDPINSFSDANYQTASQVVILNAAANDYFDVIDYSSSTGHQYANNECHFIGYLLG